jgi:hypothetical protein
VEIRVTAGIARRFGQALPGFVILFAAASLLHFAHNAEYLAAYPNLPGSWSRAGVYLAWCGVSAVGALGLVLYRLGRRGAGLAALSVYAALGFDALLHYTRAPFAHHSVGMNATIWTEVVAACLLLASVTARAVADGARAAGSAGRAR